MRITRSVIVDLWPLYSSGEASAETRALVEEFLADDPELGRRLRESPAVAAEALGGCAARPLPPDHEARALERVRGRLRGYPWLRQLAVLFTALAFGRILSDTSWDVSPRLFIVLSSIAAVFWMAHLATLARLRRRVL
jgi:hypothetical protein